MAKQKATLRQAQGKQEESLAKLLWKIADKLRKNIDAAEYFSSLRPEQESQLNEIICANLLKIKI